MHETSSSTKRPHVVVIGGGFAGLAAVRKLKKTDVDITLIDRHTYNTFQPLLYQVATAALNPGDVTWFLRAVRSGQDESAFVDRRGTAEGVRSAQCPCAGVGLGQRVGCRSRALSLGLVRCRFDGVPVGLLGNLDGLGHL